MAKWMSTREKVLRIWHQCMVMFWKAVLMRKRSISISLLEILIPIMFVTQIRVIFAPLSENLHDDYRHNRQDLLKEFSKEIVCSYAPKAAFNDELMKKTSSLLSVEIKPANSEAELLTELFKNNSINDKVMWIIFESNGASKPEILDYNIRILKEGKRISETDPYISSGFMTMQLAIEYSFVELWKTKDSSITGTNVNISEFPHYPLNLPVIPSVARPNISLIYYLTIVAFLLIPLAILNKVIHDREVGFKALMRILGINPACLYFGWIIYIMITAIPVALISSLIVKPIYNVNEISLFLFFLMYIIVSCFVIFAFGTFFSNAIKAVLASMLVWIFLAYATLALDQKMISSGKILKTVSLLLPHTGLIYGLAAFTMKKDLDEMVYQVNSSTQTSDKLVKEAKDVSLLSVMIVWTLHTIGWYFVAIYLDNVVPGKFGLKKPFYYLFRWHLKPADFRSAVRGSTNWTAVERPPPFTQPKIRVKKITMCFNQPEKLEVLKDMSIDFYPNEFSFVLGHNGAGKSTLLRIITGMYDASHGRVYVEGRDFKDSKRQKKVDPTKIISYCPQENVLAYYLSTIEHLYLFGMIKGLSRKEAKNEANIFLQEFDLTNQKNTLPNNLTIDQQRRLCLAVALIGPSEILILDEPTYSVDPQHIKNIWKILASYKVKKTIIVATNSMRTADALADRIAIIANNKIECYGSKTYLNHRYSMGHELSILMKPGFDLQNLQNALQEHVTEALPLVGSMGRMLRFEVPKKEKCSMLLRFLDHNKDDLNIQSFSLTPANVEGQFRKIGLMCQYRDRGIVVPGETYDYVFQKRRQHLIHGRPDWERLEHEELRNQQFTAMLYRKLLHVHASWNPYFFSIILALFALCLSIIVTGFTEFPRVHIEALQLNVSEFGEKFFILFHVDDDPECDKFFTTMKTTCEENGFYNFHLAKKNTATMIMSHPEMHSIEFRDRYFMAIDILKSDQINILYSHLLPLSGPIALNLFHNSLVKYQSDNSAVGIKVKSKFIWDPKNWQYRIVHTRNIKNIENAALVTTLFLLLPSVDLGIREARTLNKLLQFNADRITTFMYWLPTYFIDIGIYFFSVLITGLIVYIFYAEVISLNAVIVGEALLLLLFYGNAGIAMGYSLQLFVDHMGALYLLVMLINIFTILINNPDLLFPVLMKNMDNSVVRILEVFFHVFPQYVFACAVGNYIAMNLYNFQCKTESNCDAELAMENPCCHKCGDKYCYEPLDVLLENNRNNFGYHTIAIDLFILCAQTVGFHLSLVFCEFISRRKFRKLNLQKSIWPLKDSNLREESRAIKKILRTYRSDKTFPPETAVVIKNLSRSKRKYDILRDVNLKLNVKECIGLLGMNRSGKSSIFRILTGAIRATSGKILIHGHDYATDLDNLLAMIGFCPQKDGVVDFLTGRQTLVFFGAIRGIPHDKLQEEVDRWLDVFDLLDFENIIMKNCSLGVKKKIAVLQCLIGDLPVIFLDEPSSGMDVIARSTLGEALYQMRQLGSSILLSTQFVADAEAICDRVGILAHGQMIAFGTCANLIKKDGPVSIMKLTLHSKILPEEILKIMESIKKACPTAIFIEEFLGVLTYEFYQTISCGKIYDQLEIIKLKHPAVVSFSINRQSLEDVYWQIVGITSKREFKALSPSTRTLYKLYRDQSVRVLLSPKSSTLNIV